jgi:hypothetical protein
LKDPETKLADFKIKVLGHDFRELLKEVIVIENFEEFYNFKSLPSRYGIWMFPSGKKNVLFSFEDDGFLKGIIRASKFFGIDFRDYLLTFPFEIVNGRYKLYEFKDFLVDEEGRQIQSPAILFSGSTMIFSDDL